MLSSFQPTSPSQHSKHIPANGQENSATQGSRSTPITTQPIHFSAIISFMSAQMEQKQCPSCAVSVHQLPPFRAPAANQLLQQPDSPCSYNLLNLNTSPHGCLHWSSPANLHSPSPSISFCIHYKTVNDPK